MKDLKTSAEKSKATAAKEVKAKGANEKITSAKDAKKVNIKKDVPAKDKKH